MFKSLLNLFFDITGSIFFILKIVVVGIGKMFAFLVGAAVSSADSDQHTDIFGFSGINNEPLRYGSEPPRYDICSIRAEDRFLTESLDDQ